MGKIKFNYISKPDDIYKASFDAIKKEADFSSLNSQLHPIALRMIHATANPDLIKDIRYSKSPIQSGINALNNGATIFCDSEMVVRGITKRFLPKNNPVICTLNNPKTIEFARKNKTTRSAGAVELWREKIGGSVVVIGNAPTTLFYLLEKIHNDNWDKPELIIGLPIGYIGAIESKQALVDYAEGIEYITLISKLGGSSMASSVVNAIIGCNKESYNV
ncbi:precorrin-8X methylmutase [Alphaproteobacteria bacterium]|nr:precorrin-8X methylmutase [Alphaproteobacteria bacterium]